jgi:hypothetical protein
VSQFANGKKIIRLAEFRIRWKVDEEDNFIEWQNSQLLGDAYIISSGLYHRVNPYWEGEEITGTDISIGSYFLKNQNELDFEFEDNNF